MSVGTVGVVGAVVVLLCAMGTHGQGMRGVVVLGEIVVFVVVVLDVALTFECGVTHGQGDFRPVLLDGFGLTVD